MLRRSVWFYPAQRTLPVPFFMQPRNGGVSAASENFTFCACLDTCCLDILPIRSPADVVALGSARNA